LRLDLSLVDSILLFDLLLVNAVMFFLDSHSLGHATVVFLLLLYGLLG